MALGEGEALVVLVGITAGRRDRRRLARYFRQHSDYAVFVPDLPYRRGMRACARWLQQYLDTAIDPSRYQAVHAIVYIAGGLLLRMLPTRLAFRFERMVRFRGPIQERVSPALVRRLGRPLAGLVGGRSVLDLADGWPAALPVPDCAEHQGLIIEMGRSRMARLLGLHAAHLAPQDWEPQRLLPDADAVLRIPYGHDQAYWREPVLAAALHYLRHGVFPAPVAVATI